jgi:hypothetical protein
MAGIWRKWLVLACVGTATVGAGCGREQSEGERKDVSVALCTDRWWRDPMATGCSCQGRAECAADDCEQVLILRLDGDGTYRTGYVTLSSTTGTVGVVSGELGGGTYSTEPDGVRFSPDEGREFVSSTNCQAERLVLNHVVKVPVADSMAASLDGALGAN